MHHRARDIAGLRVGYLTALRYSRSDGKKSIWIVACDCGREIEMPASELGKKMKRGVRASCGCKKTQTLSEKHTTHGMSKHKAFAVWRSMIDRCSLPTHQAWHNYGGRGITVCERWRKSFRAFWEDMGPTYQKGLTLDREDNEENYEPNNCRWVTPKTQGRNTRLNRIIDTPWGRITVAEAAERSRLNYSTILYRIDNGVTDHKLLFSAPDFARKF